MTEKPRLATSEGGGELLGGGSVHGRENYEMKDA